MPAIVQGNTSSGKSSFSPTSHFDYKYPDGLDLKPGSKIHRKIRDLIMEDAFYSSREMSNRHTDWNKIDHTLTAYIPVDEEEQKVKDEDSRKPVSIVFPNSYAVLETLLAYYVGAFFQDPIFRYEGVGPSDVIGGILLEKIIAQQCHVNKVGLNLHTQARDAFAYGFGVVTPTWITERGTRRVRKITPSFLGLGSRESFEVEENAILFEGNALDNIDPYKYLPDTDGPIDQPQKGEFCGWVEEGNYYDLLTEEQNSDGDIFNVQYTREILERKSSIFPSDSSGRNTKSGMQGTDSQRSTRSKKLTRLKMFRKIIPSELNLGDSPYPEIWFFEIVQDEVITQAFPLNLDHGKIPVSVQAPEFDGYSITPISRIEMLYGMQEVLDFMFNSHVLNVRKAINDTLVYDPYQVNSADLKGSGPRHLRLRRPAWGRGVKDVIMQLPITDITRGNVADSSFLVQWMDRIGGADSTMQGALRQGGPERLTSAEFQGTRAGGITRMEKLVKVMGMQGMQDVARFFAAHNKQFMTQESYIKVTGDWKNVLMREYGKRGANKVIDRGRIPVTPQDVDIYYNIKARDGSIPGGNFSEHWIQLYQIIAANPELAQRFDVVRIFTHIARNLGAKNVNDFVREGGGINPQILPDETVEEEAKKGNIIPLDRSANG